MGPQNACLESHVIAEASSGNASFCPRKLTLKTEKAEKPHGVVLGRGFGLLAAHSLFPFTLGRC